MQIKNKKKDKIYTHLDGRGLKARIVFARWNGEITD